MISNHRAEMSELENTIDKEHADQLSDLREQVATQTKQTLDEKKDKTIGDLKSQGKCLKFYIFVKIDQNTILSACNLYVTCLSLKMGSVSTSNCIFPKRKTNQRIK